MSEQEGSKTKSLLNTHCTSNTRSRAIQRCMFEKIRVTNKELGVKVALQLKISKFKQTNGTDYVERYIYAQC